MLFNCSQPEVIGAAIDVARELTQQHNADIAIGAYANAFPPQPKEATANDGLDELREDLDPPGYLAWATDWRERGASLVGGCCGIGRSTLPSSNVTWADVSARVWQESAAVIFGKCLN